jgi:hypothetical protein
MSANELVVWALVAVRCFSHELLPSPGSVKIGRQVQ